MNPIPKGTQVRQVVPTIEGTVEQRRFNEDASQMEYLVTYVADGAPCQRWFLESQLVAIPATDTPQEA